jgi:hypothetical protein
MDRLPTWSLFLITSFPRFESVIDKTADRRRKLYNGRIECTYYQYPGPKPPRGHFPDRRQESPAVPNSPDADQPPPQRADPV